MRMAVVILVALALGFGGGYWTAGAGAPGPGAQPTPSAQPAPSGGHEEMDAAHEARVKAFPAKTAGLGAQPLTPKVQGGIKVFELTAKAVQWEVEPGVLRQGFAYNGQIPGPVLRATDGDRVRVVRLRQRGPQDCHEQPEWTNRFWNRDLLSTCNIIKIVRSLLSGAGRPSLFCRGSDV